MKRLIEDPIAYELLYGDFVGDLKIYTDFAKDTRRVLDCGCGTGRISFALAASASNVIGIDISENMIAFAQEKARLARCDNLTFACGDFRCIPQSNHFDRVVVGFGSVNFLLSVEDLFCLASSAYRSLDQGGKIIFELSTKSTYRAMIDQPKSYLMRQLTKTPEHLELKHPFFSVLVDSDYDSVTEILRQTRHFHFFDKEQRLAETVSLRWSNKLFAVDQIVEISESAGFSDFDRTDHTSVSNALDEQETTITITASR